MKSSKKVKQPGPGGRRLSRKARQALELKREVLQRRIAEVSAEVDRLTQEYRQFPIHEVILPSGKVRKYRTEVDPVVSRMLDDAVRERDGLRYELRMVEFMLNPPIGRTREAIYNAIVRERDRNPHVTDRELAERFFPECFTDPTDSIRIESATERVRQAIRRRQKNRP